MEQKAEEVFFGGEAHISPDAGGPYVRFLAIRTTRAPRRVFPGMAHLPHIPSL